jgi:hypothetical protein
VCCILSSSTLKFDQFGVRYVIFWNTWNAVTMGTERQRSVNIAFFFGQCAFLPYFVIFGQNDWIRNMDQEPVFMTLDPE